MNLLRYQTDVRRILRDRNAQFFSTADINSYINEARKEVALQTKCLRVLVAGASPAGTDSTVGIGVVGGAIPGAVLNANNPLASVFSTIAGVEKYPYSYANNLISSQNSGVGSICDVLSVSVTWGSTRPTLAWYAWDNFQAYARATTAGMMSYPLIWSKFQDGQRASVWLWPIPSIATEMEWDCICVPVPLVDNSTPDAIPSPHDDAVKFYAAKLAYIDTQRFAMADTMQAEFDKYLATNEAAVESGATPNYYLDDGW